MDFHKMNSTPIIQKKEIKLNPKEVEEKILSRFDNLNQEKGLRQIYSSYDFRLEEKPMLESWEKSSIFYSRIFLPHLA